MLRITEYIDAIEKKVCVNSDGEVCEGCLLGIRGDVPCISEERYAITYDDDFVVFCFLKGEEDYYCRGFGGNGDGYVWRDGECVLDCSVCFAGKNEDMWEEPCAHGGDTDAPCTECIPHEGSDYCIAEEDCENIYDEHVMMAMKVNCAKFNMDHLML